MTDTDLGMRAMADKIVEQAEYIVRLEQRVRNLRESLQERESAERELCAVPAPTPWRFSE